MTTLTSEDMIEFLGLTEDALSTDMQAAVDAHLAGLTGSLSRMLNRPLEVESFTENLVNDSMEWGRPSLSRSPLVSVTALTVNGAVWDSSLVPMTPAQWLSQVWAFGTVISITYTAGIDASVDDHLRFVLLGKAVPFTQALIARQQIQAGGSSSIVVPAPPPNIRGFSVEGLNVQYQHSHELALAAIEAAVQEQASMQWTPAELADLGLSRLRKRVVA